MVEPRVVLEVIVCSVADAVEAQQGGADRLEVIRDFERGGMTPPLKLVQEIIAVVSLPLRVMLRESCGYETLNNDEVDRLCVAAGEFSALGIEGVVLGFLHKQRIDVHLTQQILACAPNLKATFHHAFEETEPFEAIRDIKRIKQVDKILSHGGAGNWQARIEQLAKFQQAAHPEIEILAGGGLDAEKINQIARLTTVREFHVGRAARAMASIDGVVQSARVKALVEASRK
ncbi:MAG TPA: copper homeostasis protein CutC [Pyrinomonadaceae bacterium]